MNILKLAAMLMLDGTRFKAGLKEAEAFSNKTATNIQSKIASAFGFTAVTFAIKSLVDFNSKIKDSATALDISTASFQEQSFWVTQNNADVNDLILGYKGLAKARSEALSGNQKKMGLFEAMGISQEELSGSSMENLFKKAAEAFRNTDFGADKMAAANALFGKGATALLPALEESLADAAAEAHNLGQVIDKDVNATLEEMGDRIAEAGGALKNLGSEFLYAALRAKDFFGTLIGQGLLGLAQQALRVTHAVLTAINLVPGMKTPATLEAVRNLDSLLGDASNDMFNTMLDKYDPSKRKDKSKLRGKGLFDDEDEGGGKTAERHAEKMASLEERIWRLSINRLAVDEKRAALQEKIARMKERERYLESLSTPESKEQLMDTIADRMALEDERDALKNAVEKSPVADKSFITPGIASLTNVGQAGGRNFINAQETKTEKAVKETTVKVGEAVQQLKEINAKVEKGQTINASL